VIEDDPVRLRRTFAGRPSGTRFGSLDAAEQDAVVEMNRRYGSWLRCEAEAYGQSWLPAHPVRTLADRAVDALRPE
jgi:hypothetical protein